MFCPHKACKTVTTISNSSIQRPKNRKSYLRAIYFLVRSFISYSLFVLFVPRLKLGFRGSYFLLRIGSGGPPPQRLAQGSPASLLRFHTRITIKSASSLKFFIINVCFCTFLRFFRSRTRILTKSCTFWSSCWLLKDFYHGLEFQSDQNAHFSHIAQQNNNKTSGFYILKFWTELLLCRCLAAVLLQSYCCLAARRLQACC